MKLIITTIAASLLAPAASAQTAFSEISQTLLRVNATDTYPTIPLGQVTAKSNGAAAAATLTWDLDPWDPNASESTITLPLESSASMVRLPSGSILVAGQLSGSVGVGGLALTTLDEGQGILSNAGSVALGAIDPIHVAYDSDGEFLFLVDRRGRRLMVAAWDGASAMPSTFTEVAGSQSVDALARPRFARLVDVYGAEGIRVFADNGVEFAEFRPGSTGWVADTSRWLSELTRPALVPTSKFLPSNRPWDVEILGPATFPIDVRVHAEGARSTTLQFNDRTSGIQLPAGWLDAGDFASMRSDALEFAESDVRACLRFGQPQGESLLQFGELYTDVIGPYQGAQSVLVAADILPKADGTFATDRPLVGALHITVYDANASSYPVTESGTSASIAPIASIPFSIPVGTLPSELSFALPPIPENSLGLGVLLQVVVTDGTSVAWTEVFGLPIWESSPFDRDSSSQTLQGSAAETAAVRAASVGAAMRAEIKERYPDRKLTRKAKRRIQHATGG